MKNRRIIMAVKYVLKLYVTGVTSRSKTAFENIKKILNEDYKGVYSLKVIDVVRHPKLAEDDKILATPTLIKILPPPVARIIGDLNDREKVLLGLDLVAIGSVLNK
jgi:circadian clock protein KaiB